MYTDDDYTMDFTMGGFEKEITATDLVGEANIESMSITELQAEYEATKAEIQKLMTKQDIIIAEMIARQLPKTNESTFHME